jgi:small subunit ribosomal protein S19
MARGKTTAKAARRKARKLKGRIAAKKKKEFLYRGKSLEELQAMTTEEFTQLLPARARRSMERGVIAKNPKFFKHLERGDKLIKTHSRDLVVLPSMVNRKLAIHDGKNFVEVTVTPEMIGHTLGEFALTRTQVKHTGVGVGATRSSKYMPLK